MKKSKWMIVAISVLALAGLLFTACPDDPKDTSPGANKTTLKAVIKTAEDRLAEVTRAADDTGLTDGDEYAIPVVYDAFEEAIENAENVNKNAKATQKDVNDAVTDLNNAMNTFNDLVITVGIVNKNALEKAINDAEIFKASIPESEDGEGLDPGAEYASEDAHKDYQDAINIAKGVLIDSEATQTQVNTAVGDLATATGAFIAAIKAVPGGTIELDDLITAIETAKIRLAEVTRSVDGAGLTDGDEYALPADWDAFDAAIKTAEGVRDNPEVTQSAVNLAVTTLNNALKDFNDNKVKIYMDQAEIPGLIHHWWLNNENDDVGGKNLVVRDWSVNFNETEPQWGRNVMKIDPAGDEWRAPDPLYVEFDPALELQAITTTIWIKPNDLTYFEEWYDAFGADWLNSQTFLVLESGGPDNSDFFELAYCFAGERIGLGRGGRLADRADDISIGVDPFDYNGRWTHLAVTIETGKAKVYINGDMVVETPGSSVGMWEMHSAYGGTTFNIRPPVIDGIWIGGRGFHQHFRGLMSDVRVYDRVLTGTEIAAIMAESPPIQYDPPVVTAVNVTPATIDVVKGMSQSFSASVIGSNSPTRTVTWSIGNAGATSTAAGSTISANGILRVSEDESPETEIIVRATSNQPNYTHIFGTATVTVKNPMGFSKSTHSLSETVSLEFDPSWFGAYTDPVGKGYVFNTWEHGGHANDLANLPNGSYLRVVFEGLGSAWPTTVSNGNSFVEEFMTFSNSDNLDWRIFLTLEALGVIENGQGEVFIAVDPIKELMTERPLRPWGSVYFFGYFGRWEPGEHGNPKIITFMDGEKEKINVEFWIPNP